MYEYRNNCFRLVKIISIQYILVYFTVINIFITRVSILRTRDLENAQHKLIVCVFEQ